MEDTGIGLWGVPLAIFAGAIRVSTPFIFVSLGETITERSGRINLGLEGTLVFGAMTAYAIAVLTNSPWLGLVAAAATGTGLAFFFGKPFIQPSAPDLPAIPLGFWSDVPQVQAALTVNVLFLIGIAL